jgi:excisionase family DNA binding protein
MTDDRLLTATEVAALLGVRAKFVHDLGRRGVLPRVYVGDRHVRYRAGAVHEWIARNEAQPITTTRSR